MIISAIAVLRQKKFVYVQRKKPMRETYERDLCKKSMKETYKMDIWKKSVKKTYESCIYLLW